MDYLLFTYINKFANKCAAIDAWGFFLADYIVYFLLAGAALIYFLVKKKEKLHYIFVIGSSVILSRFVITELIRLIWHRSRPFVDYQVNQVIEHSASGSFPSGHIAFLFALAIAVYFFNKKWGLVFFILSLLVGLARIFVGIHYPLDILGGIVIGIVSAIVVRALIRKR
jgi:undecaprenyl-diphosphatase